MSLRSADLQFVLPGVIRTATVLAGHTDPRLDDIAQGLETAGVSLTATAPTTAERRGRHLVLSDVGRAREALSIPAATHVLLGRPPVRLLRRLGGRAAPLLVRGDVTRPVTIAPLRPPTALRYYLRTLSAARGRTARLRNAGLVGLTRLDVPLPVLLPALAGVTVVSSAASPPPPVPHLVREAAHLGVPPAAPWVLALGDGDDLQRAVFHLLDEGGPGWVVKFSRVRGAESSFDRDEAGLALVREAQGAVAAHAPRLLGRFEVDGRPASVETAVAGRPLLTLLPRHPWSLIDAVAGWTVQVGTETATPPSALGAERSRLETQVLTRWRSAGAPADLVQRLGSLPGVLQHNDLGSWNVVSDGHSFAAVDWESAKRVGLPLWDLLYFLADVLSRVDGPAGPGVLLDRSVALFSGRSPHSHILFRWVRAAVTALQLPPDAVGPIATLCWLHHGLSAAERAERLDGAAPAPVGHLARLAGPWLADPALGASWSAWSA